MKYIFILLQCTGINAFSQNIDSVITKESLYKSVSYLASDSLEGRMTGTEGIALAAEYIKRFFIQSRINATDAFPDYYDAFMIDGYINAFNVVGALKGYGSDSIIIISAHYDHIGKGHPLTAANYPSKKDKIYNGANDNATGIAAMLEIAKYFSATRTNYYTIFFVAFSGEEFGLKGSEHFIKNMRQPEVIKAVINLEMLGRPYDQRHCYYTGSINSTSVYAMNNTLKDKKAISNYFHSDYFPEQKLYTRSDHYSFMDKERQAFTIMATSPYDKHYHGVTDEVDTINFDFFCDAVKNIAIAVRYFTD